MIWIGLFVLVIEWIKLWWDDFIIIRKIINAVIFASWFERLERKILIGHPFVLCTLLADVTCLAFSEVMHVYFIICLLIMN